MIRQRLTSQNAFQIGAKLSEITPNHGPDDNINHKVTEEVLDNIMRGSYAYVGADGLHYMIDWFADEDGFHPSAPHLSNYGELVSDQAKDVFTDQLNTFQAASTNDDFPASEDILSDESLFDELFVVSGNDLPAFGHHVDASYLLANFS